MSRRVAGRPDQQQGLCHECNRERVPVWRDTARTDRRMYCDACWRVWERDTAAPVAAPVPPPVAAAKPPPTLPPPSREVVMKNDVDYFHTSETPLDVECAVCLQAWWDPCELQPCAHLFCRACLVTWNRPTCPQCRSCIEGYKAPHRALLSIVHSLPVRCSRCEWNGPRELLARHECKQKPFLDVCRVAGNQFYSQGNYAKALEEFTRGVDAGGPDPEGILPLIFCNRSLTYFKMINFQASYDDATKVIALKPDYAKAYARRAYAAGALRRPAQEELEDLRKALELDPTMTDVAARIQVLAPPKAAPTLPAPSKEALKLIDVDYFHTSEIPLDIECSVCMQPWWDACEVQPCAHVFCRQCLVTWNKLTCPQCRSGIEGYKAPHRALLSIVHSLPVRCSRCEWNGPRELLARHECKQKPFLDVCRVAGNQFYSQSNYAKALEEFTRGVDAGGPDPEGILPLILCNRSLTYFKMANFEASYDDATRAIVLKPDYAKAYARRAYAAGALRRPAQEELRDLRKALELDPTMTDVDARIQVLTSGTPLKTKTAEKPATAAPAPPVCDDSFLRTVFAQIRELHCAHGPSLRTWYTSAKRTDRVALLKDHSPYLVEKKGGTMDVEGEDLHVMAFLCPEMNVEDLVRGQGDMLFAILARLGEHQSYFDCVMEAVHAMMDCSGRREEWLRGRAEGDDVVVYAVSGAAVAAYLLVPNIHDVEIIAQQQRVKTTREYVSRYVRAAAVERLAMLLEASASWLASYVRLHRTDVPPPVPLGTCLACGKRKPSTPCEKCKCAHYCNAICRDRAQPSHVRSCFTDHGMIDKQQQARDMLRDYYKESDREDEERQAAEDGTFTAELKIISAVTDMRKNEQDPYGDGDQSYVRAVLPTDIGYKFKTVWCTGLNFNPCNPDGTCSRFIGMCYVGDAEGVRREINSEYKSVTNLVNRRESLMRFSPLHAVIVGSRMSDHFPPMCPRQFSAVAQALIDAGSNVSAKDLAGYTCMHHCSTAVGNLLSMAILPLLRRAGADPNAVNRFGSFPLLEPVMVGRADIVRVLIQVGADPFKVVGKDPGMETLLGGRDMSASTLAVLNPEISAIMRTCGPNMGLDIGHRVRFRSLLSSPHLNGQVGVIAEWHIGKYLVQMDGNTVMAKFENLERCTDQCAQCGSYDTLQRCSRCKTVSYCSTLCQRTAWPSHKPNCSVTSVWTIPPHTDASDRRGQYAHPPEGQGPRAGDFIVKMQVPNGWGTQGPILVYDNPMSFQWHVSSETYTRYAEFAAVVAKLGPKSYFMASFGPAGELKVSQTPLPLQPW